MTGVIFQSNFDCWTGTGTNGAPDILQCALDAIVAPFGEALFGVFAAAFVILPLWLAGDGDLVVPGIAAMILGGIMLPVLPPDYANMAQVVMFLGLVAALLAVANRYFMDPTF